MAKATAKCQALQKGTHPGRVVDQKQVYIVEGNDHSFLDHLNNRQGCECKVQLGCIRAGSGATGGDVVAKEEVMAYSCEAG